MDPSINRQGHRTFLYEWCRLVSIAMDSETFQVLHPNVPIKNRLCGIFKSTSWKNANGKYLEKTNSFFNVCLSCMFFFGCYIFIIQWYTNQVTSLQKPHRKKVSQETWGFNLPSSIRAGHILSAPSSWKRRTVTVTTVTITQTTQTRQIRPFGSVTCASVVLCWSLGLGCWVGGYG